MRGLEAPDGALRVVQWTTGIVGRSALRAILDSGVEPDHPAVERATAWLLDRQIQRPGDWAETVDVPPGGWYFEYANEFYPDVDDTIMVLMALEDQKQSAKPAADALSAAREALARSGPASASIIQRWTKPSCSAPPR